MFSHRMFFAVLIAPSTTRSAFMTAATHADRGRSNACDNSRVDTSCRRPASAGSQAPECSHRQREVTRAGPREPRVALAGSEGSAGSDYSFAVCTCRPSVRATGATLAGDTGIPAKQRKAPPRVAPQAGFRPCKKIAAFCVLGHQDQAWATEATRPVSPCSVASCRRPYA
jgi:hypothetical protein